MEIALQANELHTLQLNNPKVNYVQQGNGEPVILVHGLAASLHDWDDLLPELDQSGYASYALDLFGHGESDKPADHHKYTYQKVYDDFSAWLDTLQIKQPFTLIGHSLGAGLSLQYALQHPEKVKALVLVNPFYDVQQLPSILQKFFKRQLISTNLIDRTPHRLFRMFVDMTSFNFYIGRRQTHILPEHIRYQTALDYKRASSGIYNIPRTLPNLTSDLPRLQQPILLIWGNRDQTLTPVSFPKIGKVLPNVVDTHIMPICGHVPHQCHPEQFNPHVMKFLKSL